MNEKNTSIISSLPIGTIIKGGHHRYRVEEVLGQGGYGITYRVSTRVVYGNIRVDVHFAVKEYFVKGICWRSDDGITMSYAASSKDDVEESLHDFMVEGDRLAKICKGNNHIVDVNEVFPANNTAYYVLEYITGGNLQDMVSKQGALPEQTAVNMILPIVRAADYIHHHKLLHLDIKPENIMLRRNDEGNRSEPVLIDFGISLHFTADGDLTSKHDSAFASRGYAPMEQYAGITHFAPETDVYALGATLFYMLKGRAPLSAFDVRPDYVADALPQHISDRVRKAISAAMRPMAYDRLKTANDFERALLDGINEEEDINRTKKFKTEDHSTKKFKRESEPVPDMEEIQTEKTDTKSAPDFDNIDKGWHGPEPDDFGISVFAECRDKDGNVYLHIYHEHLVYHLDWHMIEPIILDAAKDSGDIGSDNALLLIQTLLKGTRISYSSYQEYKEMFINDLCDAKECIITYSDEREFMTIQERIAGLDFRHLRVCREQHLMTQAVNVETEAAVRISYNQKYCDMIAEKDVYEIIHSGDISTGWSIKDSIAQASGVDPNIGILEHSISSDDVFSTLTYCATKWMMRDHPNVNTPLLLDAMPFQIRLFHCMNGIVRDDLGIIVQAFTAVPFKKSRELPSDCKEVMIEIAGNLLNFDLSQTVSDFSGNVIFTIDMWAALEYSVKDSDGGDEHMVLPQW